MSISDCGRMTKIIANEEKRNNDKEGEIVLALHGLPHLTRLFSSRDKS